MSFDSEALLIETIHHKMNRFVLIFVLFFLCKSSFAQTADFTYTPSSSFCTPQEITFTQTSTGNPTSFIWDFGNGITGNEAIETVIYDEPGTYTVTLIAVYANTAVTKSKTITVNETPEVIISADRLRLCNPGTVNFSVTGSSSVTNWQWNFGDGTPLRSSTSNTISHTFNAYDSFRVIVTGNTAAGCMMTAAISIIIRKFELTGIVNPMQGCIPVNANFSLTATMIPGDTRQSILWHFGDGTPDALNNFASFTHRYNTTNTISTAKVILTTAQGCTNEYTFPPFAFGIPPTGITMNTVSAKDTFCASEGIQFFANAVNANAYIWDFNGVIRETNDNTITHRFASLGTKKIKVTPTFNGCAGQADSIFVFIKGVVAKYDITNVCAQKYNYTFVNNSLGNISHFEWTFPDAPGLKDSVNRTVSHVYPSSGVYYADLLLIDSITGCRDSLKQNIYTAVPVFTSSKSIVCRDSLLTYSVNQSYPQNVGYMYDYYVNGETIMHGDTTTLNYYPSVHGINQDMVIIYDSIPGTCSDTLLLSGLTKVRGPVSAFNASTLQCADTAVNFTNNSYPFFSDEPIRNYSWDLGNGRTDTARVPQPYKYSRGGTYDIRLLTTDVNGCSDDSVFTVVIHSIPKVNILPKGDTICSGENIQLIAYSSDNVSWSPSANICASCDTINISPAASVNYVALATSPFGCKKTDTSRITVYAPFDLVATPADTAICPGGIVSYSLNKNGVISWTPETYLNNSSSFSPMAKPVDDIQYKVVVTDSAGCYTDSAFTNIKVHEGPSVNAGPDLLLDYGASYTLSPVYNGDIREYLWLPGDSLSCTNCANPSGIVRSDINFTIRVTDLNGCIAEDQVFVRLNCENSNLYFPGAFTPNGDGLNDYFHPLSKGIDHIKSFTVFNRNGVKMFERKDFTPGIASMGWDGNYKGNTKLSTQTFVWVAEYECMGRTIIKKGTVMLLR